MDNNTMNDIIKALEFYANEYNYSPDISEPWEMAEIQRDEGRKARHVLELIKNKEMIKWQVFEVSTGEAEREFDTEDEAEDFRFDIDDDGGVYDVREIYK